VNVKRMCLPPAFSLENTQQWEHLYFHFLITCIEIEGTVGDRGKPSLAIMAQILFYSKGNL